MYAVLLFNGLREYTAVLLLMDRESISLYAVLLFNGLREYTDVLLLMD